MATKILGLPYTVSRLLDLKPRQEIVYYKGNFDTDLANTCSIQAPTYRQLLCQVREAASRLSREGLVRLETRHVKRTTTIDNRSYQYNEYVAVGLGS